MPRRRAQQATPQKKCKAGLSQIPESLEVHPALQEYFGYCFFKAAIRLRHAIAQAVAAYGFVAPTQLGILVILRTSPITNQVSLGEQLGIDKATMVKLIDGLEAMKLVERVAAKEDRRHKLVRITPKGIKVSHQMQGEVRSIEEGFLAELSSDERQALRSAMPKLLRKPSR